MTSKMGLHREGLRKIITDRVEAEVDAGGLTRVDLLREITFRRPLRKHEKGHGLVDTDGYECTDDEFLAWFVGQLGEGGLENTNRLAFRLLLLACLDWLSEAPERHWRS